MDGLISIAVDYAGQVETAKSVLHNLRQGRVNMHASCDGAKIAAFRNHGVNDFLNKNRSFRTNDVGAQNFACFFFNDDFHEAFGYPIAAPIAVSL